MSIKNSATLSSDNANNITGQTAPESITPTIVGNEMQDFIDSFYNRVDDTLTPSPINMTKAQLVTAIGATALVDKQYITITDRSDGFPLIIQAQGNNTVSPFGIWVNGTPLGVIMAYTGSGDLFTLNVSVDATGIMKLLKPLIIADGSQGAGKVLVSDASGKSSWLPAANYQSSILNPSAITSSSPLMAGLAGAITPTKSGNILIIITGRYTFSDTTGNTLFTLKTGTGAAPTNNSGVAGTTQQTKSYAIPSGTTFESRFTMCYIVNGLTIGNTYWIDLALSATAGGSVNISQTSITAMEQ